MSSASSSHRLNILTPEEIEDLYVYAQKVATDDQEAIAILRGISPIAWQHINLFGTFEFDETTDLVGIDAPAARFADPDYWSKALREMQEVPLG